MPGAGNDLGRHAFPTSADTHEEDACRQRDATLERLATEKILAAEHPLLQIFQAADLLHLDVLGHELQATLLLQRGGLVGIDVGQDCGKVKTILARPAMHQMANFIQHQTLHGRGALLIPIFTYMASLPLVLQ